MKQCKSCIEDIQDDAIICKHCNSLQFFCGKKIIERYFHIILVNVIFTSTAIFSAIVAYREQAKAAESEQKAQEALNMIEEITNRMQVVYETSTWKSEAYIINEQEHNTAIATFKQASIAKLQIMILNSIYSTSESTMEAPSLVRENETQALRIASPVDRFWSIIFIHNKYFSKSNIIPTSTRNELINIALNDEYIIPMVAAFETLRRIFPEDVDKNFYERLNDLQALERK